MSGVDANNVGAEALWLLGQLAGRYGVPMLMQIVEAPNTVVEELSAFVANVVRDILMLLGEEATKEALKAGFAAADAAGNAAIRAKFG